MRGPRSVFGSPLRGPFRTERTCPMNKHTTPPIELRYQYRLRVNTRRRALLDETWAACRVVWNTSHGRWLDLYRHEGVTLTEAENHAELTDWRAAKDWLRAVPVTPQQQTIIDYHRTVRAFYDKSHPGRRPRFKKTGTHHTARWTTRGFKVTGTGTGQRGDRLSLALPGGREEIPVVWSRPLPSEPKSVTVYRCPEGHYWASFVVRAEVEHVDLPPVDGGLDMGLTTLVTSNDGRGDVPNPRYAKADRARLCRVDQRYSRGLSDKARQRSARAHGKVARRRRDHHMRTARHVARSYNEIGVEDLRIRNMLANRRLSRAISDAGWGDWLACLEHQRRKIGQTVHYQDPRNTTQTCSECCTKTKCRLGLADRVFVCESCGLVLDRDVNAARNLVPGRMKPGRVLTTEDPGPCGDLGSASPRIPRL